MADLLDAASEVDGFCRRMNWRHCVIANGYGHHAPCAELKEAPGMVANSQALEKKSRWQ